MAQQWKLVILESPYAGDIEANTNYARRCVRDCLFRGESAQASHLLFTQPGILRDDKISERKLGIEAGLAWLPVADYQVFYTDLGWSPGMRSALGLILMRTSQHTIVKLKDFRIRAIDGPIQLPPSQDQLVEDFLLSHVE